MDTLAIPIKLLDPDLPVPKCAYPGDAGVDLYAACEVELAPFERALVPCGIALALPPGYAGLVLPRSGLAAKQGISLVNSPGLIDSNYRGEIKAVLVNLDPHNTFHAVRGDRIAQLMVIRAENAAFAVCEKLPPSERGEGGFGSSGVRKLDREEKGATL